MENQIYASKEEIINEFKEQFPPNEENDAISLANYFLSRGGKFKKQFIKKDVEKYLQKRVENGYSAGIKRPLINSEVSSSSISEECPINKFNRKHWLAQVEYIYFTKGIFDYEQRSRALSTMHKTEFLQNESGGYQNLFNSIEEHIQMMLSWGYYKVCDDTVFLRHIAERVDNRYHIKSKNKYVVDYVINRIKPGMKPGEEIIIQHEDEILQDVSRGIYDTQSNASKEKDMSNINDILNQQKIS